MSTAAPKQARPYKGEELELTVESLAQGGRASLGATTASSSSSPAACPATACAPGVSKSKKGYAEAATVELLAPSPDRIPDPCVHGGEPCPGAPWQGLPYERQLALKAEQVDDALRRLGGLDGFELEPIDAAAERWRYRNKLEYSFGDAEGELALGFHPRGDWRRVVDVDDCHLASERNNAARNEVREWARENGLPPYESTDGRGVLRHLVVREGIRTGQVQTRLVTSPAEFPRPRSTSTPIIEGPAGGTDGPTGVLGEEYLEEELCGLRFRISHPAFFQTNTEMAETLYGIAGEYAGLDGTRATSSTSSAASARSGCARRDAGEVVWGIEIVPEADRRRRAERRPERDRQRALPGRRRPHGSGRWSREAGRPDLVVVDPPRAGLSRKIVRRLIECEAPRIVYVSCNPTTLAPNAAQLSEAGYRLTPRAARSTCSPRPRTSSASPCWSAGVGFVMLSARLRRRRGPRARGRLAAGGALPRSSATPRCGPTTHPCAKGLETARRLRRGVRARIELGVAVIALDRHAPGRSPPKSTGSGSTRERLWLGVGAGFTEKPLTTMRERFPVLRGELPGRPAGPRRDGPEDVRLRRRRVGRRLLQLDDARFAAEARGQVEAGAGRGGRAAAPRVGLRPHGRRPRTRRSACQGGVLLPRAPRRLPGNTSTAWASPGGHASASRAESRRERKAELAPLQGPRHTVVRGWRAPRRGHDRRGRGRRAEADGRGHTSV